MSKRSSHSTNSGQFKKIPFEKRFYESILEDSKGCWIWQKCRDRDGYGRTSIDRKQIWAHRASWVLHYSEIPRGLCVLHKCDNPPCVNPEHLFLGTNEDNMLDKINKGRQTRGELVNTNKIKEKDVLRIRAMLGRGLSGREIARRLGLKDHHIYDIKNRRSWRWL